MPINDPGKPIEEGKAWPVPLSASLRLQMISPGYDRESLIVNEAKGWFVAGCNIGEWLRVLDRLGEREKYRLYLVPKSLRDASIDGLLCIPLDVRNTDLPNGCVSLMAVELKLIASGVDGELWIPRNGILTPRMKPDRYLNAISSQPGRVSLWLPNNGLIVFEKEDRTDPSEWISTPKKQNGMPHAFRTRHRRLRLSKVLTATANVRFDIATASQWRSPPEGVAIPERFQGIRLLTPPQLENLFEEERDAIGGEPLSSNSKDSPFQDSGLGSAISDWTNGMKQWFLKQFFEDKKSASNPNTNSSSHGSLGAMGSISEQLFQWLSKSLEGKRNEQLEKLMELMKNDPDQALKYAIPLADGMDGLHRGLARPSSTLSSHGTNFSLRGGSGPADFWNIQAGMQQRLRAAYLAQANREITLGRFRRAAYIYAHLLGDLSTSASILEKGKHYVEAAVLYGDKLKRPRDQARCLELASQFREAANVYEQMGELLLAGDAWKKEGDESKALALYERKIEALLKTSHTIDAAILIDTKLNDRNRAKELLWQQWPGGPQLLPSLVHAFQWLGEEGAHQEALERLAGFKQQMLNKDSQLLTNLAIKLTETYPDNRLKERAEDIARIASVKDFSKLGHFDRENRISNLTRLTNQDPLFARDAYRFMLQLQQEAKTASQALVPSTRTNVSSALRPNATKLRELPLVKLELNDPILMMKIGSEILAVSHGLMAERLLVHRCSLLNVEGPGFSSTALQLSNPLPDDRIRVFTAERTGNLIVRIYLSDHSIHFSDNVLRNKLDNTKPWTIQPAGGKGILAQAIGTGTTLWSICKTDGSLELRAEQANTIQSYDLVPAIEAQLAKRAASVPELDEFDWFNLHLVIIEETPYIVCDWMLFTIRNEALYFLGDFDASVRAVIGSVPRTRKRLGVITKRSLSKHYISELSVDNERLSESHNFDHICWMHDGIAAVSDRELWIFPNTGLATLHTTLPQAPIALMALMSFGASMLVVGYPDGTIQRWRIE